MRTKVLLACLASTSCFATEPTSVPIVTGETLTVRATAALECNDCPEAVPSLSYQTPNDLHIGVAGVSLLRSADDASPHPLLSATPAHDADLVAGATFCAVDLGSIPEGVYSHMAVKLDWIRYTVDATGHAAGWVLPGTLEVDYALSDYDDLGLGSRVQGEYLATFAADGLDVPQAGSQPVDFPPAHPGGTVDVSDGAYWITFPAPRPIVIHHALPESINVNVTYFIEDAFGWVDREAPGFVENAFDLSDDPATTERPVRMAIQGFALDTCNTCP